MPVPTGPDAESSGGSIYTAGRALALLAGFEYHSESFALPLRNAVVFAVLKPDVSPTTHNF